MILVKYVPQFNESEKIHYKITNECVKVSIEEKEELFDFSEMPNGIAQKIHSDIFEFCPIISAERKEGVLYLELLNFIGFDATEDEKFPEWQEVKLDGED